MTAAHVHSPSYRFPISAFDGREYATCGGCSAKIQSQQTEDRRGAWTVRDEALLIDEARAEMDADLASREPAEILDATMTPRAAVLFLHVMDSMTDQENATWAIEASLLSAAPVAAAPAPMWFRLGKADTGYVEGDTRYRTTDGRMVAAGRWVESRFRGEKPVRRYFSWVDGRLVTEYVTSLAEAKQIAERELAGILAAEAVAETETVETTTDPAPSKPMRVPAGQSLDLTGAVCLDPEPHKPHAIAGSLVGTCPGLPPRIIIVPCGGAKLSEPAPAGAMYIGSYHAATRRAAEALGGELWILSAKYGFLRPTETIEPYDLRMGQPGSVTPEELRRQAEEYGIARAEDVTILAGWAYAAPAVLVWPHAKLPLAGTRGMGHQLQVLARIAGGSSVIVRDGAEAVEALAPTVAELRDATHLGLINRIDETTGASVGMYRDVNCAPLEWRELLRDEPAEPLDIEDARAAAQDVGLSQILDAIVPAAETLAGRPVVRVTEPPCCLRGCNKCL